MRFESTTLLSMTWKHPLKTSRSSGRSLRPNVKPILIVQTPSPLPPLALLASIFRTRTDPHILMFFRNAQITLRILIICKSYPFLLCLSFCSTYVLNLHICSLYSDLILVLTRFLFCPYCYSRCGRLSSYSLSKGRLLFSFIFVHISYIFIFAHRLLLF